VIGEWLALGTAGLGFAGAWLAFLQSRQNKGKIAEVHVLVNSQLSAVLARAALLTLTLEEAGVEVPPDVKEPPPAGGQ
jgi:hypothetical protein